MERSLLMVIRKKLHFKLGKSQVLLMK